MHGDARKEEQEVADRAVKDVRDGGDEEGVERGICMRREVEVGAKRKTAATPSAGTLSSGRGCGDGVGCNNGGDGSRAGRAAGRGRGAGHGGERGQGQKGEGDGCAEGESGRKEREGRGR